MDKSHIRIDEGIPRGRKRGGRLSVKPADLERQARDEAGKYLSRYTPELKANALEAAIRTLEAGGRVETVCQQFQIPVSTMYSWLIGNEKVAQMRTQFFDGQVARNLHEIRHARSPLELARAREELSGWFKVAERRDAASYGIKQEITHNITGLSDALAAISQARLAAPQLPQSTTSIIDVTPTQPIDPKADGVA